MAQQPQKPAAFHVTAADAVTEGPSWTGHANDAFPKNGSLSKTHWEMWMLEGVQQDGQAGVTITFFIDGSQTFHGSDPLHITFHALLPDGTVEKHHLIAKAVRTAPDSDSDSDPRSVVLEWPGKDDGGWSRLEIALDHGRATATFDTPAVRGSLALTSVTATPDPTAGPLAPAVHHRQVMTGATAEARMSFPGSGRELAFAGKGGHDRCWMEAGFPAILSDSTYVRGHAGPFTFASLGVVSRLGARAGQVCQKFRLLRDGEEVFAGTNDRVSLTEDYWCLRAKRGGRGVKGDFLDTATGYSLDFVRPAAGRHWSFDITHERLWWSIPLGPPPLVREGNNGFVASVTGGEVGGEVFAGAGDTCQVALPELATLMKLKEMKMKALAAQAQGQEQGGAGQA
ncbi:uncharacterized protein LTHEOB_10371 [Neofusicoccum parvum]|uniref:Uncharacterized protein LTHEOB_10371 n=1 Tax=Neofusicoccum parvum TaxID=310453 RepID=A0ACB5SCD7_9PEZI|nr:uncharacterized protein LTHEOB_10371 [Neofusicoccum parvum]